MINYFKDFDSDPNDSQGIGHIVTEIRIDNDDDSANRKIDLSDIPILTLRNIVLFPNVTMPVAIGRQKSLNLIHEAQKNKTAIGVVCQKDSSTEDPGLDDLYRVGVVAEIIKILELPDNTTNVILQGRGRLSIDSLTAKAPYLRAKVEQSAEQMPDEHDQEFMVLVNSIRDLTLKMLSNLGDEGKELFFAIKNIDNPFYFINFLSANFPFEVADKHMPFTYT